MISNDLIIPEKKDNLFFDKEEEEEEELLEEDDFNPPSLVREDESFLTKTPVIKFTTPIRRKKDDIEDEEEAFRAPENVNTKIVTPTPDYSDNEVVNKRVKELIGNSNEVNYELEDEAVQEAVMEAFIIKYQNLAINYSHKYKIVFPEGKSLNTIHKHYHEIIKSIYVNMNINKTQVLYILSLMVIEFIFVKWFNIPMAGFTKGELKRMHKYDTLMIELGESMYSTGGGEPAPIHQRIMTTLLWNILIFLGIKILTSYIGGEGASDYIREVIEKLFEDEISINDIESGEAININSEKSDISDGLTGLLSGNTDGISEIITTLGGGFTQNIEKNNGNRNKAKKRPRIIFNG